MVDPEGVESGLTAFDGCEYLVLNRPLSMILLIIVFVPFKCIKHVINNIALSRRVTCAIIIILAMPPGQIKYNRGDLNNCYVNT